MSYLISVPHPYGTPYLIYRVKNVEELIDDFNFAVSENRIELYKTTVGAVRSGRDIAKVTKSAEVKLAGIIRIASSKTENAKRFIVFDQFPTTASDTVNRSLNVGDTVTESEIAVFDLKSFIESIK